MSDERSEEGIESTDLFAGFDPDEHELMTMNGYDDCIVGVVERFGQNPIVCYDKEKVIQRLETDGCTRDEAEEFFYFNQIGAWVGDSTPCFLSANSVIHRNSGGVVGLEEAGGGDGQASNYRDELKWSLHELKKANEPDKP